MGGKYAGLNQWMICQSWCSTENIMVFRRSSYHRKISRREFLRVGAGIAALLERVIGRQHRKEETSNGF
jgi:hypothetical protein